MVEHDVRVHKDDVVVSFECLSHEGYLDPGTPAVGVVRRIDEFVVIAMDLGCWELAWLFYGIFGEIANAPNM
jgi:hypothetical protein